MPRPPLAKRYSDLKTHSHRPKESYHETLMVSKKAKDKSAADYFFKITKKHSAQVAALEAGTAHMLRLMSRDIAPLTRVYYDEDDHIVGVASKAIPGFKPNKQDPLQLEDLYIGDTRLLGNELDRMDFREELRKLSQRLDRDPDVNTRYVYQWYQSTLNLFNAARSNTAVSVKTTIDEFIVGKKELNNYAVKDDLLPILNRRLDQLNKRVEKTPRDRERYASEIQRLEASIAKAKQLIHSYANKISPEFIEKMEKLRNTQIIEPVTINGMEITAKDIEKYKNLDSLAAGLVGSYNMEDDDNHNLNNMKNGVRIDFDMAQWWSISHHYKEDKYLNPINRSPLGTIFEITERDIRNFPDIKDAKPFYWPTIITSVAESALDTLYKGIKYRLSKNFYDDSDRRVFKELKNDPVFNFFKYKNFLKFVSTPDELLESIVDLHTEADAKLVDKYTGEEYLLKEKWLDAVKDHKQRLHNVLAHMEDFREYMNKYGGLVEKMILDEFKQEKERYQNKSAEKQSIYQDYINAINLDKISENIKNATKVFTVSKEVENPVIHEEYNPEVNPALGPAMSI